MLKNEILQFFSEHFDTSKQVLVEKSCKNKFTHISKLQKLIFFIIEKVLLFEKKFVLLRVKSNNIVWNRN